jgi:hypothetical protein
MTGFVLFNTLVWHGGPIGLVHGIVTALLATAIVLPLTVWGGTHRLVANSLMYAGVAAVPALGGVIAVESMFGGNLFQSVIGVTVIMGSAMTLGFWLGAAAQTVLGDRASTLAELRALSRDPAWDTHIEELHRRVAESSVATFLHGTIQTRLTAAALQLQTAAKTNDLVRAEAAVDLAVATVALASQPAGHVLPVSPADRLSAFALAWTGIANISLDLPLGSEAATGAAGPTGQERMTAWALVTDAVEECVTNAIRHGKASAVQVTCRDLGDALEATISDNGTWDKKTATAGREPVDAAQPSGIGLTLVDRISDGNWSVVKTGEGTTLVLRVHI